MTTPSDPFGPPDDRPGSQPQQPWGSPPGPPPGQQWGAPQGPPAHGAQPWGSTPGPGGPPRNGLGVAALVLGILALVLSFTVVGGIVLGLAAVVLGALGRGRVKRREADNGGSATAGIVLGVLGIVIAGAVVAAGVAFFGSDTGQSLVECLEDAGNDVAAQEACQQEVLDGIEGQ